MQLKLIDWVVVAAYAVLSLAIGLRFARRAGRSLEQYFLSGRTAPWWLLGTSMVATTFSADTPNLVTDLVRTGGVSTNWLWWAFLITGMLTVFFYAKLWRRSGALTDINFYELRYSGAPARFLRGFRAVYLGVFFNIVIMATVTLAAIKIAGALLGLDPYTTVALAALLTMVYATTSGLWGVLVTDLFQFVLAMIGSVAAAYYAVTLPEVGGLSGLVTHPNVAGKLSLLPDFSDPAQVMTVLLIPLAVQWWSTWYPGSEPGGGGYIAQRMLAARTEKDAMAATLWFNIAHYALRPWPWILVALASLIVYPSLSDLAKRFPYVDPSFMRNDLAYSAMLLFVPHGVLGLIVASLAAAYMSTISTHLNWGASYVVDDVYKRFLKPNATDAHYVAVGRAVDRGADAACLPRRTRAAQRHASVPDLIADRRRHRAHLPAALVLVADQCLGRDRRYGDFLPGRALFPIRPCSAVGLSAAASVARAGRRRLDHHLGMASRHLRDAADRPGDLAGLLRQDQAGSLWLARRCRYRRGGSIARQRVRRAHRLVPRLCRCLRVAVRDRLPYLRPLRIWVRLPCGCRRCRFRTLPHGSENWVLDVVTPRRRQED